MFGYNNNKILDSVKGGMLKGIYIKIDYQLVFAIDDYFIILDTEGDCCSETYISDVVKNISLPSFPEKFCKEYKIISIDEIELMEGEYLPRESRQEEDEVYGYKILLECKGDEPNSITIIYRNSSNGYYGGWMNISKVDKVDIQNLHMIKYDFHNPF